MAARTARASGPASITPAGVATDNAGNLFIADTDNHTIRKVVAATGAVTTLAGLAGVSGSADGTGKPGPGLTIRRTWRSMGPAMCMWLTR